MARTLRIMAAALLAIAWTPRQISAQASKAANLSKEDVKAVVAKYRTDDAALQVRTWASQMTVPIVKSVDFREEVMSSLPPDLLKLRVKNDALVESLRQLWRPVLGLYGRERVYEIVIIDHRTPLLMSDSGVALVVTTGMLERADSDDALLGVVAHEVAHEYFVKRSYETRQRYRLLAASEGDAGRALSSLAELSRIELECDAFAAVTLAAIGRNPAEFADELVKTGREYGAPYESYHPPGAQRKEVIVGVVPGEALKVKPRTSEAFKRMKVLLSKL
ncbi:MAG TPA: hypothetical protein VF297_29865 [Pyrinomonadaceae bacterium]